MRKTVAEIAKLVNGEVVGNSNIAITGLRGIKEALEGDLTFVDNPKYAPLIERTKASAIIVSRKVISQAKTLIHADNPSLAFSKVASLFIEEDRLPLKGIHKTAIIAEDAQIGKNVAVGPYAIIEGKVKIGDGSVIHSGCFIGYKTVIGKECFLYPHVTVRERVNIGDRVIIHNGAVIGSDGFGYISVDGIHAKIPQIGTVIIEDDVEIGANVTIDRARFDKTFVGRGTKIDNLVHIAHNVIIGENCIIVAQVGISGSVVVENNVILAGQVGVAGHLTIGEGAIVASQSGVSKSIPPHTMVFGYPAKPHDEAKKINACVQRLPHYVEIIQELKEKIRHLESKIK